ncbi:hypothetical protein [Clostridium senegalense]|uniref:hypothetical protein n=1 Tax=Clostridium senegalense TaxID=1465809 RepID=UPI0002883972|nr:hypothetical protein [Clostridium senegalense]
MLEIYSSYRCKTCKYEFVLLSEQEQEQIKNSRYLVCPYCSSQKVVKQNKADSLKECMSARRYKREKGAIRQR